MKQFIKYGLIYVAVCMSAILFALGVITSYYNIDLWSVLI